MKSYIWSIALFGSDTWLLRTADQKYPEGFETWCWGRLKKKIRWTDRVNNEEVLHSVKEERNILRTIKIRKDNWSDLILRRNGLLKLDRWKDWSVRRRGRRRKQLWTALRQGHDTVNWKRKQQIAFGAELVLEESVGLVVRQAKEWCLPPILPARKQGWASTKYFSAEKGSTYENVWRAESLTIRVFTSTEWINRFH